MARIGTAATCRSPSPVSPPPLHIFCAVTVGGKRGGRALGFLGEKGRVSQVEEKKKPKTIVIGPNKSVGYDLLAILPARTLKLLHLL